MDKNKATFSSKSKSEENPFTTEHGIQKIMYSMYKNVFGCAPFTGVAFKETIDGKRTSSYGYADEPCEHWQRMSEIQNYSKLSYVNKTKQKFNAERDEE